MTLGISMVVKNEAHRIAACLRDISSAVDSIVVVDTGSSDGTPQLLKETLGVTALCVPEPASDPQEITQARNLSLESNPCDWILVIDPDETITREDILKIKSLMASEEPAFFLVWRNRRSGVVFDDYKLALFKNRLGIRYDGSVHSNPQSSLRRLGLKATLAADVVISHSLEEQNAFRLSRKERLKRYAASDPTWWRYQWFLGYTHFKEKDFESAVPLLRDTCNSLSKDFPVECLNAHMVLTDLNARKGIHDKCTRIMRQAATFYDEVADDFEVKANQQMGPWIAETVDLIKQNRLDAIHCYEFAY